MEWLRAIFDRSYAEPWRTLRAGLITAAVLIVIGSAVALALAAFTWAAAI